MLLATARKIRPRQDLIAALTLAAIAIPEQLATAQLAGLPASQGMIVFAVSALVMTLVARNRHLSVGADSTIAPVLVAAAAGAALPGGMALIAAMVGVILLIVAVFRLEGIARLLSMPVAAGVMAGISIHILVGRIPTALGLDIAPGSVLEILGRVWRDLPAAQVAPLALTVLVTGICLLGHASQRRLPAPLIAIVVAAVLAKLIDPEGMVFSISIGETLSWGLQPPTLEPVAALSLIPTALVVAFLCLFQTTVVLREEIRDTPALRRNAFASVGLCNLASAAAGGFAVNSSPPRTQIIRDSDGTGQLVGLFAAAVGLGILLAFPGLLAQLPQAALTGVLVFVALRLFPLRQFRKLAAQSRAEAGIAMATTALVMILPLQLGLPLAILLSLLYATLPLFAAQVVELRQIPGTTVWWHGTDAQDTMPRDDVLVLGITSPVNFANAEGITLEVRKFLGARNPKPAVLVLEGAGMLSIDLTGAEHLSTLIRDVQSAGIRIGLARVEAQRARHQLVRSGVVELLGRDRLFNSVDHAIRALV